MTGSAGYTPVVRLGRGEIGSLWLATDQAARPVVVAVFEPAEAITIGLLAELAALIDQLTRGGQLRVLAGDRSGATPWIVAPAADWPAVAGLFLARGRTFLLAPDAGRTVAAAIAAAPPLPAPAPEPAGVTMAAVTTAEGPLSEEPLPEDPLSEDPLPGVVVTAEAGPPPDLTYVLDPPWPPPRRESPPASRPPEAALRTGPGVR